MLLERGWKPWDYCAALVICLEAGCAIVSMTNQVEGEEFDIYSISVICATTKELLHISVKRNNPSRHNLFFVSNLHTS
jgi:fructose-1,6-bisphosphatase/inositol monophosphatase family enzyme